MAPVPDNINEEISSEVAQRMRGGDPADIERALREVYLAQGVEPNEEFLRQQAQHISDL